MLTPDLPADAASRWNPPPRLEARLSKRRRRSNLHTPPASPGGMLTPASLATTRRQTLLDARKTLLRQRAAHVEKVRRMRASSHAGVAERLLALQQSMKAADEARDAILAKVAGSCASEVARAKRLAMETKARREEETRALRASVEERMAEAQRRREEALRDRGSRKRGGRSSRSSSKSNEAEEVREIRKEKHIPTEEERQDAVRRIQRVWRRSRDALLVKAFVDLGLTIESVRDADFIEISERFQKPGVIAATGDLLSRLGLLEGLSDAVAKSCRTFLSAYLILGHPAEVLSNADNGETEQALITQSKDLLIAFESFLSTPAFPLPSEHPLNSAWLSFNSAFNAWKARDSETLISTMIAQYAELDLIWQKVKDDTVEHVAADFREGIKENQLLLLVRIRRLAGERTRDLIRAAVKESRRTRLPRKEKRDMKPRTAPEEAADTAPVTTREALPSPPSSPVVARELAQPSFTVVEDGMMENRQIVHELALDREFRLKPRKRAGVEKMVHDQAHRAFWDTMQVDIDRGELEKWIPGLAKTVKEKLLRLLSPSGSLHRSVDDSIDLALIAQQCRHGSYDPSSLLRYVLSLLPQICSPARDADVQALLALSTAPGTTFITLLQPLLDVLEAMSLDHANFLLAISAPAVIAEAIPYEQRLFAADLAARRTSLARTAAWLRAARQEPTDAPNDVLDRAWSALLWNEPADDAGGEAPTPTPETLHLDVFRLRDTRAAVRILVAAASIILTVKTLLRRDPRAAWKDLKTRVLSLLSSSPSTSSSVPSQSPEEIGAAVRAFVESTGTAPPAVLVNIESSVTRLLRRRTADPVVRVVHKRLRGFVDERIRDAGSSREAVRLASVGSELLATWGVAEILGDVMGIVESVRRWRNVDRETYGCWYSQILAGTDLRALEAGQGVNT